MPQATRITLVPLAACLVVAAVGCATTPAAQPQAGHASSIEGRIASIDTKPWAYDGNAVIQVDTAERGRVAVQLPARWNLCKAAPVDVEALAVDMRVRVVGAAGGDGEVVVCQDAAHRIVPVESGR